MLYIILLQSDPYSAIGWGVYIMRGSRKFVRGGPTLTVFVDEGRYDPNTTKSGTSSGQPAKRHLNGVSLACR